MKIVVFGDVMLDRYVDGVVRGSSAEAHVPIFDYHGAIDYPGGAANVAANIKSLGADPILVSGVGADDTAADLAVVLQQMGIANRLSVLRDKRHTTKKTRYCVDGKQVFRADRETRFPVTDPHVMATAIAALDGADALVISDYGKGVVTRVDELLEAAQGMPVIVDAKANFHRFQLATVIKPNAAELETAAASAEELRALVGCGSVVATYGGDGLVVANVDGVYTIPAHYREVSDVVGAGDTVAAALAVEMARGYGVLDAARFANAAAAIVVGKRGTATATREEVEALLADLPRGRLQEGRRTGATVAG